MDNEKIDYQISLEDEKKILNQYANISQNKLFSKQSDLDPEDELFSKRIEKGKYMLVLEGSELDLRQANRVLRGMAYNLIQAYQGPDSKDL